MTDLPTYEQIAGWLGPEWRFCEDDWSPLDPECLKHNYVWRIITCPITTNQREGLCLRHSSGQRVVVKAPDGGLSTQCWESLFWSIKRHDIHEPDRGLSHYDKCVTRLDEPDQPKCAACGAAADRFRLKIKDGASESVHELCGSCNAQPPNVIAHAIRARQSTVADSSRPCPKCNRYLWSDLRQECAGCGVTANSLSVTTGDSSDSRVQTPSLNTFCLGHFPSGSVTIVSPSYADADHWLYDTREVRRVPPPGEQHEKASGKEGTEKVVAIQEADQVQSIRQTSEAAQAEKRSRRANPASGNVHNAPAWRHDLPTPALAWCEARLAEQLATGGSDTQYERDRLVKRWKAGQELDAEWKRLYNDKYKGSWCRRESIDAGIASLRLERPLISWKRRK